MLTVLLVAESQLWNLQLPVPVALAAVAVLGYVMGRKNQYAAVSQEIQARREIKRAQGVARELESIAENLRRNLAAHHSSVGRFKDRIASMSANQHDLAWKELCEEAEEMLQPTMKLASQLANAYDHIRQQTNHLMTFTEIRTDPLTGICNRRALDETLESQFALRGRYNLSFAIVIIDIDNFKQFNDQRGHLHGDHILKLVARLFDETMRDTDVVCRYGGEEFVIVMPQTDLEGACVFSERLRSLVQSTLDVTVSCGVANALDGDSPQSLLSRADNALYSAKAAGRNIVYHHDGQVTSDSTNLAAAAIGLPMPQVSESLKRLAAELPQHSGSLN